MGVGRYCGVPGWVRELAGGGERSRSGREREHLWSVGVVGRGLSGGVAMNAGSTGSGRVTMMVRGMGNAGYSA